MYSIYYVHCCCLRIRLETRPRARMILCDIHKDVLRVSYGRLYPMISWRSVGAYRRITWHTSTAAVVYWPTKHLCKIYSKALVLYIRRAQTKWKHVEKKLQRKRLGLTAVALRTNSRDCGDYCCCWCSRLGHHTRLPPAWPCPPLSRRLHQQGPGEGAPNHVEHPIHMINRLGKHSSSRIHRG